MRKGLIVSLAAIALLFWSFGMAFADDDVGSKKIGAAKKPYVVFAWNDLGMHCLNPTYDTAVILPPYNSLYVQVVKRGNPPTIVNSGISVSYSIAGNTYSYGKRSYGQFWDNMQALFGITLPHDKGLNLTDPTVNNGLSGGMLAKGDYYVANGIPVTPVLDKKLKWNPYQVANITVKDASGKVIAKTKATIPTSDEINCAKCHGADAFNDILAKHDALHGTDLMNSKPVICAGCHGDPILGQTDEGAAGIYLSDAIHSSHADRGAACYDCHPGETTKCSRSLAHTAADGNCTTCHGQMSDVASSIEAGRIPWSGEPKCYTCHNVSSQVDTGDALYRNSRGHGNLFCSACHGSPHAMVPSSQKSDNYQAKQYQSAARTIGDCKVCHRTSRGGGGASEFAHEHGGGRKSACSVCHTGFTAAADSSKWPHAFLWKSR